MDLKLYSLPTSTGGGFELSKSSISSKNSPGSVSSNGGGGGLSNANSLANRLKIERRKPNWTECENIFLLDQFSIHREILTCKATDASTNLRKQEIWRTICSNLNKQNVLVRRTPAEVRRKWKNLVTAAKKELWEIRHSIQVTGINKKLSDLSSRVLQLHQGHNFGGGHLNNNNMAYGIMNGLLNNGMAHLLSNGSFKGGQIAQALSENGYNSGGDGYNSDDGDIDPNFTPISPIVQLSESHMNNRDHMLDDDSCCSDDDGSNSIVDLSITQQCGTPVPGPTTTTTTVVGPTTSPTSTTTATNSYLHNKKMLNLAYLGLRPRVPNNNGIISRDSNNNNHDDHEKNHHNSSEIPSSERPTIIQQNNGFLSSAEDKFDDEVDDFDDDSDREIDVSNHKTIVVERPSIYTTTAHSISMGKMSSNGSGSRKYFTFSDQDLYRTKLELQVEILKLRKRKLIRELMKRRAFAAYLLRNKNKNSSTKNDQKTQFNVNGRIINKRNTKRIAKFIRKRKICKKVEKIEPKPENDSETAETVVVVNGDIQ